MATKDIIDRMLVSRTDNPTPRIPEPLDEAQADSEYDRMYRVGWNQCRAAMLRPTQKSDYDLVVESRKKYDLSGGA